MRWLLQDFAGIATCKAVSLEEEPVSQTRSHLSNWCAIYLFFHSTISFLAVFCFLSLSQSYWGSTTQFSLFLSVSWALQWDFSIRISFISFFSFSSLFIIVELLFNVMLSFVFSFLLPLSATILYFTINIGIAWRFCADFQSIDGF